ncbi:MAG: inactive transglutaminase family protein [Magnetococcales bacterium]|nr:inactive transglutaminase family protein [Magnetococcales bacterium]
MSKRHLYILTTILLLAGAGLFAAKLLIFGLPLTPQKKLNLWEVEAHINFIGRGGPVKVSQILPQTQRRYSIVDQGFVSPGYGLSTTYEKPNKQVVFSKRSVTGEQNLYYRLTVLDKGLDKTKKRQDKPEAFSVDWKGAKLVAAQAIIDKATEKSADSSTLIAALIEQFNAIESASHVTALFGKSRSLELKAEIVVGILSLAQLPARSVHGLDLRRSHYQPSFSHWIEVYDKGMWHPYSLTTGQPTELTNHFPWWRGPVPFVELSGGKKLNTKLSVSWGEESALLSVKKASDEIEKALLNISFFSLPLDVQQVYRVMIVAPLGALLLVFLRNVIGIGTFGTFMPVLMAMSFRETELLWGILLFTIIISISLVVRIYFESLKLMVVPRLSALLIVVILVMAGLSILGHKLDMGGGLSVALFPMVILTMTVERISILWDERGPAQAIQHGIGSLAVASLCYVVMTQNLVEHLFFVFPELLLVILAFTLLLGRYTGYRLMELFRFRALVKE